MSDVALYIAVIIALEVMRWSVGPTAAFVVAAIAFAFFVGALWGAGDMKRRLRTNANRSEDIEL